MVESVEACRHHSKQERRLVYGDNHSVCGSFLSSVSAVINSSQLSPNTRMILNFCLNVRSVVFQYVVGGGCGNRNLSELLHALLRLLTLLISVMISHCITL